MKLGTATPFLQFDERGQMELLRLLHDVEEGVTDRADYLYLLHLVSCYIVSGISPRIVHEWARNNEIPADVVLPTEALIERRGGPSWLD